MTDIVRVNMSSFVESSMNFVLSKEMFIFMFFGSSARDVELRDPFLHLARHRDRVGAALLDDAQPDRRDAVVAGYPADIGQSLFDIRHVAEPYRLPDRLAAAAGDHEVLEFFRPCAPRSGPARWIRSCRDQ